MKSVYKILVGMPAGKRQHGRRKCNRDNDVKIILDK
jgi:hypothetical protein